MRSGAGFDAGSGFGAGAGGAAGGAPGCAAEGGARPAVPGAPGRRVLVIVPAWNEADGLAAVLKELRTAVPWADILVVDDGSTDLTAETAKAAGARVAR